MKKIQIKNRYTNEIMFEIEAKNMKEAVEKAVKEEKSLFNADLSKSDLSNANLSNANLYEANLSNANLSNANLSKSDLVGVKITKKQGPEFLKALNIKVEE